MNDSSAPGSASSGKSPNRQCVRALPKDETTQRLALDGMFRLHGAVETKLKRGVSAAKKGRSTAFVELDQMVTFLRHELDPKRPDRSEVTLDAKTSRAIGAGTLVGLRCLDEQALKRSLNAIRSAILSWQPKPRERDQRPPIILGPLDFCLARQQESGERGKR